MVDRLRILLNRPLQDGDRRRLLAVAVAVIAAAAGLFAVLDDAGPVRNAKPADARTTTPTETTATATVAISTPAAPNEESDLPPTLRPSGGDIMRSKRAARRFLTGYLPFTYGRGSADRIPSVSAQLRTELARSRPRVPVSERRRRARVELLQSNGVSRERADLLALVRDDRRRYSVHLELVNTPTGWLVSGLGS